MNTELQKLQERAEFEISLLQQDEDSARKQAKEYLEKLVREADKLKQALEDPKYDSKYLRVDQLTWFEEYTRRYKEEVTRAENIKNTLQSLTNTIKLVKDFK